MKQPFGLFTEVPGTDEQGQPTMVVELVVPLSVRFSRAVRKALKHYRKGMFMARIGSNNKPLHQSQRISVRRGLLTPTIAPHKLGHNTAMAGVAPISNAETARKVKTQAALAKAIHEEFGGDDA